MISKLLISVLISFGFVFTANAQRPQTNTPDHLVNKPVSNLHKKFIPVTLLSYTIDSLSIIPGSFSVTGVDSNSYVLDPVNASISWKRRPQVDSVYVRYRLFPFKLNAVTRRLDYEKIENNFVIQSAIYNNSGKQGSENFFNFGNITYNGSFGRAISFGNSQDAVLTSNLNLQISGYLADSIEISAAITDNNIPIQPDGNTADLSDFDKIFLQFKKKNWALTMGDIDLRQNQNYFLNFYKRLQGASFETSTQISKNVSNKTLISGAVAKGKFTRNIFQGQEGNQGPYRLQGANNELYFVVLAGTEKVFVDGVSLQRGEDQDYVINYNTAEITFTQKRMITKDSRIQIEFEYSNQSFQNVNLYLYDEAYIDKKLKLRLGLFSNSDSRNSPINQTLTSDQIRFLNQLGDSVNNAFYPNAPLDTLGAGKILYQKVDTVYKDVNGIYYHDSVYVFSVNPNVNLYNLSFTDVGQGNGDYVPNLNGVNGNVYMWVPPVNGQKQGQYEAAIFLVTPKTLRIATVGADYMPNKNTSVTTELSTSHYDVNTLSNLGKTNDDGFAGRLLLKNLHPFLSSEKGLTLASTASYEYVQGKFQPVERLRPVEFLRDWGLPLVVNPANETLYGTSFELDDRKKNSFRYEFSGYDRNTDFRGIRNVITHHQDFSGWVLNDQLSITNSNSGTDKGYYFRPTIDISKTLPWLKDYRFNVNYSIEHNEMKNKQADTVSPVSFAFTTIQASLKSPEKKPNHWGMSFLTRDNSYPDGSKLVKGDRSQNINVFAELNGNKRHQFRINATFRNLQVLNSTVTTQQADKSLLGRAEYIVNEWKGLLTGNALYEVGSGQEQKRAYSYLQVPAGTGQYAWIDLNGDGIQELNEFVLAQYPDQALFIRVFTPTNVYVKANYNTFNYSFNINPKALLGPKGTGSRALRFFSRVNIKSSLQLNQKQIASGFVQLNPLKAPVNDTALITRSSVLVNTFSFNKADPKWGFDLSNTQNTNKSLLTYGYQTQSLKEWNVRTRVSLTKFILLNTTFKMGSNQLLSTSKDFDSSNYSLQQYSVEPDLSYTRKTNFRVTIGYKYYEKTNAFEYGGEKYSSQSITSDMKYNMLQTTSIEGKFTYTGINYTGEANSTVSYVILEGLLPGKNYLWSLDITRKLGNNLELSVQYEGRKPGEGSTIHTGRASLRAIL